MTALDEWRETQREDVTLTSDHQLRAFLTAADPARARLDLLAGMSPVEARILARTTR